MRLARLVREKIVKDLVERLSNTPSFYIVSFTKIPATEMNILRRKLREADSQMFVVKKTLLKIAFKKVNIDEKVNDFLEGPVALVFLKSDPVPSSKVLIEFSKEKETFEIRGGLLKDKILYKEDIVRLSKLPSLEVMRAQTVFALKAPITNFVFSLKNIINKLVWCLEEIRKKKEAESHE